MIEQNSAVASVRPDVSVDAAPTARSLVRSPHPLGPYPRSMTDWLDHWAQAAPDRVFLAERDGEALAQGHLRGGARRGAQHRAGADRPRPLGRAAGRDPVGQQRRPRADRARRDDRRRTLRAGIAALFAGRQGFRQAQGDPRHPDAGPRLRRRRGAVRARRSRRPCRRTSRSSRATESAGGPPVDDASTRCSRSRRGREVDAAHAKVGPDTIAKLLFTSGSTGAPKGVINTQRMMTSNQAMLGASTRATPTAPPVLLDWLPWSHTFGGNNNFNLVLSNGGSLLHRRRQAAAGRDRGDRAQPARGVADRLLQRAERLRDAAALSSGGRRPAPEPVRRLQCFCLRRRGARAPCARGIRAAWRWRRSATSCRS